MSKSIFSFLMLLSMPFCLFTQDLTNGRVAFYPFNGNAIDQTGTNDGTVYGATLVPDRFGIANRAYRFDGVNDYIEIPHSPSLNFGVNDDFSISFWVKIEEQKDLNGNNDIIGKWLAHTSYGYPYAIRYYSQYAPSGFQRKILAIRYDTQSCNHTPKVQTDCQLINEQWLHIAFIKSGKTLTMYENGNLVSTAEDNTSEHCGTDNTTPITIGMRYNKMRPFTGAIDDISFYNRAISKNEIDLLFSENGWIAPPKPNTEIMAFAIPEQTKPAEINSVNNTISITVPCNTDLSKLAPTFSIPNHTFITVNNISQVSGQSVNNFNQPVTYTVVSEDRCSSSDWLVTVNKEEVIPQEAELKTRFTSFSIPTQIGATVINTNERTIKIVLPCSADLTQLAPEFTAYGSATVFIGNQPQISGTSKVDFKQPVIYTVVGEDGCSSGDWSVTVTKEEVSPVETELKTRFTSFSIPTQIGASIIDVNERTIKTTLPCSADLTQLAPEFTAYGNATIFIGNQPQISGTTKIDFKQPVIYTVVSEDGCSSSDWFATVTKEKVSPEEAELKTRFTSFSVPAQIGASLINTIERSIKITLPCSADLIQLVPEFKAYGNATVYIGNEQQISGTSTANFNQQVTYTVVSEDGCSSSDWTILVVREISSLLSSKFSIPNIITPNNDGKNDAWIVKDEENPEVINIEIYNRWGKLVYAQNNYRNQWKADNLSSGVYYYKILFCPDAELKGIIHVLK